MLKAVIFDSDGLLFDSERIVQHAWNVAGNRLGYGNVGDNITETLGCNRVWRDTYFRRLYGEDFPCETFQKYNREAFQAYVKTHGIPIKPGLFPLLAFLRDEQIRTAVATSASRGYAMRNLTDAGLLSYFETVLCGDMVTKAKPDPEIYLKTCQLLKVTPYDCAALEDSPNGVQAAYRAGLTAIMIPDLLPYREEYASYTSAHFSSLEMAIPFLKRLI